MKESLKKHFNTFIKLSDEEFNYIFSYFTFKTYHKNELIFDEGDTIENEYYIVKGLVKIYFIDKLGKEHVVSLSYEQLWISDYLALYTSEKSCLTAICIEDCKILSISLKDKDKICEEIPILGKHFKEISRKVIINNNERIVSMLTLDVNGKYEWFKYKFAKIIHKIPKSLIASYIGVSREALSRNKIKKNSEKYSLYNNLYEKIISFVVYLYYT